jgi:SAM-dependent methyltransferase
MNQAEKELIIKRYSERAKNYGSSPLTLGWTKGKHLLRYHILLSQWEFNGETLLDFGCGFGDMYGYIKKSELNVIYHGYDINPDLITIGQIKYPDIQLSTEDIFTFNKSKSFDFAVSSGVHNLKLEDNWKFIKQTFERFAFLCRKGFALNFVSNKVNIFADHLYHTDPAMVLNLAYSYSKKIILRNDYMPYEFSIFVDLQDEFDKTSVIYPEYLPYIAPEEIIGD